MGPGAEVDWTSQDQRVGTGSLVVASDPAPQQDQSIAWTVNNNWKG